MNASTCYACRRTLRAQYQCRHCNNPICVTCKDAHERRCKGSIVATFQAMRDAGADVYDGVDVEAYMRELRGDA